MDRVPNPALNVRYGPPSIALVPSPVQNGSVATPSWTIRLSLRSPLVSVSPRAFPFQSRPGEKETDYAEVVLRIVKTAPPRDAIEDLLTRDVIDLSWDVLRLRRLKAGLLRGAISSSIFQVMWPTWLRGRV